MNTYTLKNKLFKESDSIIQHYYIEYLSQNYCSLLDRDNFDFNNSNARESSLIKWQTVQNLNLNEIAKTCSERKEYVSMILEFYQNKEYENCIINYKNNTDNAYTASSQKWTFNIVYKHIISLEKEYIKVKRKYVENTPFLLDYTFHNTSNIKYNIAYIEEIINNGEQKIKELEGENPILLEQYRTSKPLLISLLATLKKNELEISKKPKPQIERKLLPLFNDIEKADGGYGTGTGKLNYNSYSQEWFVSFIPSLSDIENSGTAIIDFTVDRNGRILLCKVKSNSFTLDEKEIIKNAFVEQAKFTKNESSDSNAPYYKGTFEWKINP